MTSTNSHGRGSGETPAPGLGRRRFLGRALGWWASLGFFSAFGPLPIACSGVDIDTRTTGALLGLGAPPFVPDLDSEEWPRSRALKVLFGSVPATSVETALASPAALRRHIAERSRQDFDVGRTQRLDGWLLAESEIAVAILTAPGRG